MDKRVPGKDTMRYRLKCPFCFNRYDTIYKKKLKVENSYYTVQKKRCLSLFSQWTEISSARRELRQFIARIETNIAFFVPYRREKFFFKLRTTTSNDTEFFSNCFIFQYENRQKMNSTTTKQQNNRFCKEGNLFHTVQGSCETNPRVRFPCMVPLPS